MADEEEIYLITHTYIDKVIKCGTINELNLRNHGLNARWGLTLSKLLSRSDCHLTTLDLGSNNLGGDGVDMLCKYLIKDEQITSIDLSRNNIHGVGIYALANLMERNKTLEDLKLRDNNINDLEVKVLLDAVQENTTLKKLNLKGNSLSVKSVSALWELMTSTENSLKYLNISRNEFDEDAMDLIFEALSKSTSIEQLDVSSNNITNSVIARAAELHVPNPRLTSLNLSDNLLSNEILSSIIRIMDNYRTIESIIIGRNHFTSDAISNFLTNITLIENATNLRHIDLQNVFLTSDIRKEFNRLKSKYPGLILTGLEGYTSMQGTDGMKMLEHYLQQNQLTQQYDKKSSSSS